MRFKVAVLVFAVGCSVMFADSLLAQRGQATKQLLGFCQLYVHGQVEMTVTYHELLCKLFSVFLFI